jgi:hypothetical protein
MFRIGNVILQSGFSVPEWIVKLPKPSKMKRRLMGKIQRPDAVNPSRNIGRREAIKKRYEGTPNKFCFVYTLTLQGYGHGLKTSKKEHRACNLRQGRRRWFFHCKVLTSISCECVSMVFPVLSRLLVHILGSWAILYSLSSTLMDFRAATRWDPPVLYQSMAQF